MLQTKSSKQYILNLTSRLNNIKHTTYYSDPEINKSSGSQRFQRGYVT